jgi:arylsulfatase A-like enzyme
VIRDAHVLPFASLSRKPGRSNILVIWGDDIGQSNLSCYTHGLMGSANLRMTATSN